jgi:hypothetical protein
MTPTSRKQDDNDKKNPDPTPTPTPDPVPYSDPQPAPNPNCDDAEECKRKCDDAYPNLSPCGDLKNPAWNFGGFVYNSESSVVKGVSDKSAELGGNWNGEYLRFDPGDGKDLQKIKDEYPYNDPKKFRTGTFSSLKHHNVVDSFDLGDSFGSVISASCCEVVSGKANEATKYQIHNIKGENDTKIIETYTGIGSLYFVPYTMV